MLNISIRGLFEAGVHFGHQTRRWNPKMAPYIYGTKDGIHIINLDRTFTLLQQALKAAEDVVAEGGRILFVGTKRQAGDRVAEAAIRCGQYYVNHRWLGGMLTNWKTVSQSIKKLDDLEKKLKDENVVLKKKEVLDTERHIVKLQRALGGVRNMGGIPSALFVLDVTTDRTAVKEAHVLGVPVIGVCDTNSDPTLIDYPIPGNDDSVKAIDLYCSALESTIIDGIQKGLSSAGVDVGALESPTVRSSRKKADKAVKEEEVAENSAE
jgi:small subunit ribosomal protein S2